MTGLKYYIIDLETTGLNSAYHEVVEFSIIRASDRMQLTRFIKAVHPERASLDALEATGKTISDLNVGRSHLEVVEEVNRFFAMDQGSPAHRCIVGHNVVAFDVKFLHSMWDSVGQAFPANLYLDTLHLTKNFLKTRDTSQIVLPKTARGKVSTTLHSSLQITGAQKITAKAHTAESDTRNTFMLWKKLVDDHKIDYVDHIKTIPHITINAQAEEEDSNDLDVSEYNE